MREAPGTRSALSKVVVVLRKTWSGGRVEEREAGTFVEEVLAPSVQAL